MLSLKCLALILGWLIQGMKKMWLCTANFGKISYMQTFLILGGIQESTVLNGLILQTFLILGGIQKSTVLNVLILKMWRDLDQTGHLIILLILILNLYQSVNKILGFILEIIHWRQTIQVQNFFELKAVAQKFQWNIPTVQINVRPKTKICNYKNR